MGEDFQLKNGCRVSQPKSSVSNARKINKNKIQNKIMLPSKRQLTEFGEY